MLSKLKARIRRRNKQVFEDVTCKNCDTVFTGRFCPNCGQAFKDYDRPFSFIVFNFMFDFFAFDERFFKTIGLLFVRPGYLTREYFDGRRVRYAPPFRVFIFLSFVLFLLLQVYTNQGLRSAMDYELDNGVAKLDSVSEAVIDSLKVDLKDTPGVDLATDSISKTISLNSLKDLGNFQSILDKAALQLEEDLAKETDPKQRQMLRYYIMLCRSPEQATAKLFKYMSWAFFLLVPIFALFLKLAYVRRRKNYIRHLIFSLHIHSYLFLLFTVLVTMHLTLPYDLGAMTTIFVFAFPIYTIWAMKYFYGQRLTKVFFKFLGVTFLYNIVFLAVVVVVFMNVLSVFEFM